MKSLLDAQTRKMFRRGFSIVGSIGVLTGALLAPAACGGDDERVQASAVAIGTTAGALLEADLLSANGEYTNCRGHVDGDPWSVEIASGAGILNPQLEVVIDDTACELTLVSLTTTAETLAATPAIPLSTAFALAASSFDLPVAFHANASLSSVNFDANFVLTILYSDDSNSNTGNSGSTYDVIAGSAAAQSVQAPDYGITIDLDISTNAEDVVLSATGDVDLTANAVDGQTYVVVLGGGLVAYEAIDAAFVAAAGDVAPLPVPLAIPAVDFALGGLDLTASPIRTLIIANTQEGVRSYQTFQITFLPPV